MKIIILFFCINLFVSCGIFKNKAEIRFKYLTVEQVHNTPEKLLLYKELTTTFINTWQKDSSCQKETQYYLGEWRGTSLEWADKVKQSRIVNILPSPNYDTLVFFVTWFSCEDGYYDNGITVGQPLVVFLDTNHGLQLVCLKPDFRITNHGQNTVAKMEKNLQYLMVRGAYLTSSNEIDTTYAYRVLTDANIWFDTMEENMEKGRLLREFKEKYYAYLKDKHPTFYK